MQQYNQEEMQNFGEDSWCAQKKLFWLVQKLIMVNWEEYTGPLYTSKNLGRVPHNSFVSQISFSSKSFYFSVKEKTRIATKGDVLKAPANPNWEISATTQWVIIRGMFWWK